LSTYVNRAVEKGVCTDGKRASTQSFADGAWSSERDQESVQGRRRVDAVYVGGGEVQAHLMAGAPEPPRRRTCGQAEVTQDLARDALVVDEGNDAHGSPTARSGEHVDTVDATRKLTLRLALRRPIRRLPRTLRHEMRGKAK